MINEIVRMRLGRNGDGSRPLGWKKVANKLKCTLKTVQEIRRSPEYADHVTEVCKSIGIVRLQAKACRKNRSLQSWLENAFGIDIYSARSVEAAIDDLPLKSSSDCFMSDVEHVENLTEQAEELIIEDTSTICLTRKHVKWLLDQGYTADLNRLILRAASMTRLVCSRQKPSWLTEKNESEKGEYNG